MCLVIETKALDLLLELVLFIVLRQQLYNTGCRSLSLCDSCLKGWGYSSESYKEKPCAFIDNIRESVMRLLEKGQIIREWTHDGK